MLFIDLDFDGCWVKMWTDLSICVSAFDYTAWLKILLVDLVLEVFGETIIVRLDAWLLYLVLGCFDQNLTG